MYLRRYFGGRHCKRRFQFALSAVVAVPSAFLSYSIASSISPHAEEQNSFGQTREHEYCTSIGQKLHGGICAETGSDALIAAPTDAPGSFKWGSPGIFRGATSETNGAVNTAILAAYGESAHPAAFYCANLKAGGFTDWYLPAKDELGILSENRSVIGGFAIAAYLSSTEVDEHNAVFFGMRNGCRRKSALLHCRVRCTRRPSVTAR